MRIDSVIGHPAVRGLVGAILCGVAILGSSLDAQEQRSRAIGGTSTSKETARQDSAVDEPGYLGLIADVRGALGRGARIVSLTENSPAATAGLRKGDVILAINERPVATLDDLAAVLAPLPPGGKVVFDLEREGRPLAIQVTLGRRPMATAEAPGFGKLPESAPLPEKLPEPGARQPSQGAAATSGGPVPVAVGRGQLLGVRTAPVSEEIRRRLALPAASGALVVSRVVGSPADRAGLPLDAVVVAANGEAVYEPSDLARIVSQVGPNREIEIEYFAAGKRQQVKLTLGDALDAGPLEGAATAEPVGKASGAQGGRADLTARVEQLERRIRDLERRIQELERR